MLWSWDTRTGRPLAGPVEVKEDVWVKSQPDDRVLAVSTYADSKMAYHLADPRTLAPLSPVLLHNEVGAFHPGGQFVATASGVLDGRARLVSFTGRTIGPPVPHPDRAHLVLFNPAGDRLLTAGVDKTLRLWAVP